jgi:putative DNA primase/helicase
MTTLFVCSQASDASAIAARGFSTIQAGTWTLPELSEQRGRKVRVLRHDVHAARGCAAVLSALSCDVQLLTHDVDVQTADLLSEPTTPMFPVPPDTPNGPEGHDQGVGDPEVPGNDPDGYSVALTRADTIEPEAIRWLWDGWLAAGKFHVLAGVPGVGKSTIALALAATITSGGRWPDGTRATPGNVLIWSGEDDPADTLVPRLLAMGADVKRIWFVGDVREGVDLVSFDPSRHMAGLERRAADIDVRMVLVDPVVSAVSGDSHKNAEVRRSLQPLVDLAVRLDCAMVGITHFSKGTAGRDPTQRVTGSLAFAALARIVLVAAKLPDEEGGNPGRILARSKCNIGIDTGGFGYSIEQTELDTRPGLFASRVLWGETIEGTARELLADAESQDDGERSQTDEAREWLTGVLSSGSMKASDVQREARQAGIGEKALRRAREQLGIKPQKDSFAAGWRWALRVGEDAQLATKMPKVPEDAQTNCVGTFDDGGHLRSGDDIVEVEF